MEYLPTLGEKWLHSRGNVGKYSLHGSYGLIPPQSLAASLPLKSYRRNPSRIAGSYSNHSPFSGAFTRC